MSKRKKALSLSLVLLIMVSFSGCGLEDSISNFVGEIIDNVSNPNPAEQTEDEANEGKPTITDDKSSNSSGLYFIPDAETETAADTPEENTVDSFYANAPYMTDDSTAAPAPTSDNKDVLSTVSPKESSDPSSQNLFGEAPENYSVDIIVSSTDLAYNYYKKGTKAKLYMGAYVLYLDGSSVYASEDGYETTMGVVKDSITDYQGVLEMCNPWTVTSYLLTESGFDINNIHFNETGSETISGIECKVYEAMYDDDTDSSGSYAIARIYFSHDYNCTMKYVNISGGQNGSASTETTYVQYASLVLNAVTDANVNIPAGAIYQ